MTKAAATGTQMRECEIGVASADTLLLGPPSLHGHPAVSSMEQQQAARDARQDAPPAPTQP